MLPVDIIAEGLANGVDKWHFANHYLGASIRRFIEQEGLPMPLNPAVRQGEYRVSPRSISMPEVMGALEQAGFKLHRRWQYKNFGIITSFYEGTFGSTEIHCDWECPWKTPEAGSFSLYFRPPASITQTHWAYLAYYEKERFPQQLEEIVAFLNKLTALSDEFESLFAKAEKKLSIRKTLLSSMLRHITAEPGLCYDLQPSSHWYHLLVSMESSEHCLRFRLPPPADAAQVRQMMEQTLRLIREMPEACASCRGFHLRSKCGTMPQMPAGRPPAPPLAPPAQRMQNFLESLNESLAGACSFCHKEKSSTLCVQLKHGRYLRLRISHSTPDRELAELPRRLRKLCRLLNAAGTLQVELTPLPADICWTRNQNRRLS